MRFELTMPERMLLSLLKFSLHGISSNADFFNQATSEDWDDCYNLSVLHGVMALAWDGISMLDSTLQPYADLKISWAISAELYEQKYSYYCEVFNQLSADLQARGISIVPIKGISFSSYYPIPCHRENGDIDIFAFYTDMRPDAHELAFNEVHRIMEEQGIEVDCNSSKKHSIFYYKGIPIENHYVFLNEHLVKSDFNLEEYLHKIFNPQHLVLQGKYNILMPSDEFNTLFVSCHAAQHFGSGLSLHHLYDWACLVNSRGLTISPEMHDQRLLRFIFSLTKICNDYLGTAVDVPDEKNLASEVLHEILRTPFHNTLMPDNKCKKIVFKMKRMLYQHNFDKKIFGQSLQKTFWYSVFFHLKHPDLIFGK